MKAEEAILTRRSTRVYSDRSVEQEKLEQVLEAGRYAPSGGNNQTTHFIVIRSQEVLTELARLVKQEFAKMEETPGMYKSLAGAIRRSKGEVYVFHYNAPVLILTANRIEYGNNIADCACCLENMMIEANALDLGTCWINQLKWLNENEVITQYLRTIGLTEEERVYGALSVGYAKNGLPDRKALPRTGNPVSWVD
ncbi:MAG: nitroreductase [Firmicutes bacterium]|nr:nitroreductase [Bacillota bacterium]